MRAGGTGCAEAEVLSYHVSAKNSNCTGGGGSCVRDSFV